MRESSPQVEEVRLAPSPEGIIPLAPSTTLFDGYAAALWGTMAGSTFTLSVVLLFLAKHYDHTAVIVGAAVVGLTTLLGCGLHLLFRKMFHKIYSAEHFVKAFLVSAMLGALMFVIFPMLALLTFAWLKLRSVKEEWSMVLQWLSNDPVSLLKNRPC